MKAKSHQKFVLNAVGTKGDVLPLIAIARELAQRGAACHVLGIQSLESAAARAGVPYTSVAPDCIEEGKAGELEEYSERFIKRYQPSFEPILDFFQREVSEGQRLVVVNTKDDSASNLAAEKYALPLCRLHLTPYHLRSLIRPPWPWQGLIRGPLGKTFQRRVLPGAYARMRAHPRVLEILNRYRGELSLLPVQTVRTPDALIGQHLALFPAWYGEAAEDWPTSLAFAGFPLLEAAPELPTALCDFVKSNPMPVVFTPGTGQTDVRRFFDVAGEFCELLGIPGVFLSPELGGSPRHEQILHCDYVDLGALLPRARLLVHHGGIGTTARALRAAVPQIVCPVAYDQFDNAHRVHELGAGAFLDPALFGPSTLAASARALFDDALLPQRLRGLGNAWQDGASCAAEALLASVAVRG